MFVQRRIYMAPAGEGNDLAGMDRGDDLEDKLPPSTIDDSVKQEANAEEAAVEELVEQATKADDSDTPQRDEKGKFVKKEREVPNHVPRERMQEAVDRERLAREAAEGRLRELESQLRTVDRNADNEKLEADIEKLEQQHAKLMLDGEAEKAAAVMKDIRLRERQIGISSNEALTERAKEQAREEMRMELTIERLETTYPEFDPNHQGYDDGLVEMTLALQRHKIGQGLTPTKALLAAASDIMKRMHSDGGKGEERGLAAAAKGADRKAQQVDKNLDTAKRQPASIKATGKDSDKGGEQAFNIGSMTQAEIAALPEATKRRLRGDEI